MQALLPFFGGRRSKLVVEEVLSRRSFLPVMHVHVGARCDVIRF